MHDHLTAVQAAGVWSGALILLIVALAFRVVANRRKHKVLFGDGGVEAMTIASRAFGNSAEYVPLGIGAMILMALTGSASWEVHLFGVTFFAGRLVHAAGLRFGPGPGAGRMIGMILTLLALIGAALLLIIRPHLP